MNFRILAACFVGGVLAACSGAPPEGGADYEIESSGRRAPAAASDDDEVIGDEALAGEDEDAPATGSNPEQDGEDAGAPPTPPTPAPTVVTAKVDGVTFAVSDTTLWSEASYAGRYDIFVKVTGPGVAAGSDIHVWAERTGTGCLNTQNYIAYRPEGDTQYMPQSTSEPACGLSITELPTTVGGRFKGKFVGTLRGINTTTPKTKNITLEFDVLRTK